MDNKITQKEQKFYDCLFLDVEVFFSIIEKFLKGEMKKVKRKEKEYESIWKFVNNFKVKDSFSEELKIVMAVVFIMVSAFWINDKSAIPVAHSDELAMTNAQVKDTIDTRGMELNAKEADVKVVNGYKLESSEKLCEEDKEQKRSSALCGKDDEEKVKEIVLEKQKELRLQIINSKPRVVILSCPESNYGHPSRSDTKGKHRDEDCCPDPDEWPKLGCSYDAKGYSIMMSGSK